MDDEAIKDITSVLTVVGGRIVHGDGPFSSLAPPLPPASPDWSPVRTYGGYYQSPGAAVTRAQHGAPDIALHGHGRSSVDHLSGATGLWGTAGCSCFVF